MYILELSNHAETKILKRTKRDRILAGQTEKALNNIAKNPFYPSLKSHKANVAVTNSKAYASWVNGEYRIVWDYEKENRISILDFGTHNEVYV